MLLDFGMCDWTNAELEEYERLCMATGGTFGYLRQEDQESVDEDVREFLASGSPALSDAEGAVVQLEKRKRYEGNVKGDERFEWYQDTLALPPPPGATKGPGVVK